MRTPGQYERFYRAAQDHPLNFFTKGEVASVEKPAGWQAAVTVKDTLLGESIARAAWTWWCSPRAWCRNGARARFCNLTYRQGPELPGPAGRLPRFALHLLPLRDPAHGHLRGRRGARAHGLRPRARKTRWARR